MWPRLRRIFALLPRRCIVRKTGAEPAVQFGLREVDTDSAPIGGSLIGDALRKALESMPPRTDRDQVVVLITDGEDHDSFPLDAARQANVTRIVFASSSSVYGNSPTLPKHEKMQTNPG